MKRWLEVSLTVNGELAEAVADVLARYAPEGVVTEQGVAFRDQEDAGSGVGPVTVRAYLPADGALEETRQKLEEALFYLGRIQALPDPVYREIADQDWTQAWRAHYRPIPIGKRLLILPAWLDPPDPGRIPIRIDPGMAFGTGTHPTTQLCLELIEAYYSDIKPRPATDEPSPVQQRPCTVIDIGTGSGILSIAALKLGANRALGLDIDPASIANARANADRNGIGEQFTLARGSLQDVQEGSYPLRMAGLVLANILAPVITRLFEQGLSRLVEPGGWLILSGILVGQAAGIMEAAEGRGLRLVERREMGEWVALVYGGAL
jgi:ribosomal protein L11 methyltransferase